jgi:hypothetical protein
MPKSTQYLYATKKGAEPGLKFVDAIGDEMLFFLFINCREDSAHYSAVAMFVLLTRKA